MGLRGEPMGSNGAVDEESDERGRFGSSRGCLDFRPKVSSSAKSSRVKKWFVERGGSNECGICTIFAAIAGCCGMWVVISAVARGDGCESFGGDGAIGLIGPENEYLSEVNGF